MGWGLGYDSRWGRWIGYGVTAYCDAPKCSKTIYRGLSYVCGGQEPYGGEFGCGLYFCWEHLYYHKFRNADRSDGYCKRCIAHKASYTPKPEHPEWIEHVLTHESWNEWRLENPEEVVKLRAQVTKDEEPGAIA